MKRFTNNKLTPEDYRSQKRNSKMNKKDKRRKKK